MNYTRLLFHVSLLILLLFGFSLIAFAQSTFGNVVGVVQDSSQAVIPEVLLTLRNLEDNGTRSITSGVDGSFQVLSLKPGRYEITAAKPGFTDFKIAEVALEARQTLRVEIKLQVAMVAESVEVTTDDSPVINTEGGTIGETKTFTEVTQL